MAHYIMRTNNKFFNTKIWIGLLALAVVSCQETSIHDQIVDKKAELSKIQVELQELEAQDTTVKKTNYPMVNTQEITKQDFKSFIEVHGVVNTDENITVVAEATGVIKAIKVKEGQYVKKGTLLAILDTDILNKNIEEIETQLELASDLFEKQEALRKQDIGTEVQYLEAKNRKQSLERSIESIKAQQRKAYITAPISGEVDNIFPNVGEMAGPSQPMFRIVNLSKVYLEAEISEAYLGKIQKNKSVEIMFPSIGKEWVEGTVTYVGNYINPGNRTFSIRVSPKKSSKNFLPNLLGIVKLQEFELKDAIVVPDKVIQDDGNSSYVFTVDTNNIVHKKNIKTGPSYKGSVLVEEGLTAGEDLVIKGQTLVVDSSRVTLN